MLNSVWGKFVERSNLVKTEQIDDPQVFFDYLTSDEITVLDVNLLGDEILDIGTSTATSLFNPSPKPMWLLLRLPLRMHDFSSTISSTCYENASCTMTPTRWFISARILQIVLGNLIFGNLLCLEQLYKRTATSSNFPPKKYNFQDFPIKTRKRLKDMLCTCSSWIIEAKIDSTITGSLDLALF